MFWTTRAVPLKTSSKIRRSKSAVTAAGDPIIQEFKLHKEVRFTLHDYRNMEYK